MNRIRLGKGEKGREREKRNARTVLEIERKSKHVTHLYAVLLTISLYAENNT